MYCDKLVEEVLLLFDKMPELNSKYVYDRSLLKNVNKLIKTIVIVFNYYEF